MNDTDLKDQTAAPEVAVAEETSLARPGVVGLAPIAMQADAVEIIQRQTRIHQAVNIALIKVTEPGDWVAQRIGDDVFLQPGGSASAKIARYIALELRGPSGEGKPLKEVVVREGTETRGVRVVYSARSLVLASLSGIPPEMAAWLDLETTRWEDEDFTGRKIDESGKIVRRDGVRALPSDLSSAGDSAARNRAVRQMTGLGKVPLDLALRAFDKTAEQLMRLVQKGHGFGSSGERTGQKVAEPGVAEKAKALWEEILRRTGGDESAAGQVLREITSYPAAKDGKYPAFEGVKSWQQITTERAVGIAQKKLGQHAVFGDKAQAQREREPGEDG